MANGWTDRERILVLLDDDRGEGPLEAGAELAARRRARLVGLFVEDRDLLRSSGLPFAREIGLASGMPRPISAGAVERRFADGARRLRARLEELAREHDFEGVFEVGRGNRAQVVLHRIRPEDLLVIGRADWPRRPTGAEGMLEHAGCAVLVIGRAAPVPTSTGQPMVYIDGSAAAERALARALAFARSDDRASLTLLFGPGVGASGTRERAARMLVDHGVDARCVELARIEPLELLRTVRRERPRLLFVARDSGLLIDPAGRELFELDEIPLVLVP